MRERARIVDRFAGPLADRLGRSAETLRKHGLTAHDFSGQVVTVRWHDDSSAMFQHAFFVQDDSLNSIAIFTEHCGYLEIAQIAVESIEESTPGWIAGQAELNDLVAGQRIINLGIVGNSLVADLEVDRIFIELRSGDMSDVSVTQRPPS